MKNGFFSGLRNYSPKYVIKCKFEMLKISKIKQRST